MGFNLEDYEPVSARLDRWLKEERTNGTHSPSVRTFMISDPTSDICVFRAELWLIGETREEDWLVSTGWAEEVRGSGNVNRTSHVENCETSAVGRALANAGFAGSDMTKRPSREEMAKVQRSSNGPAFERGNDARMPSVTITQPAGLATDKQKNMIRAISKSHGALPPANLDQMSKGEASAFIDKLKTMEGNAQADEQDLQAEEPF
jgi:hypothetical protein